MEVNYIPAEFNVRLPVELAKALVAIAEREQMHPRDLIEQIVREYVSAQINVEAGK